MIFVFHGEDQPALREGLLRFRQGYEEASYWQRELSELSPYLSASQLFEKKELVIVEDPSLTELPNPLISRLAKQSKDLALVFSHRLAPADLERFAGFRVQSFVPQVPKNVFSFLDALTARRRRDALLRAHRLLREGNDLDFLLKMMGWQLRSLVQVKGGAVKGLNPYVVKKLQRFVGDWDWERLRRSLADVLAEDRRRKRGRKRPLDLLINRITR